MDSYVYIMASRKHGTLYVGVTSDLGGRVSEHKQKLHPNSFTAKYDVTCLVWYQEFDDINEAIAHEKRLKRWNRSWKIQLIEKTNPEWIDLHRDVI